VRDYPILAFLEPLLTQWHTLQAEARREAGLESVSDDWFIATKRTGEMADPSALRKWFGRMIRQGALPEGFSPHNLRHSHASYFSAANGHKVTITLAKLLGHHDPEVTRTSYVDAIDEDAALALQNFGLSLTTRLGFSSETAG